MNKVFRTTSPPPLHYVPFMAALLAMLLLAACSGKQEEPRSTPSDTVAGSALPAARTGDSGGAARHLPLPTDCPRYTGTIDTIAVEMQICRKGEDLRGLYRYKKIGKDIEIQGHVEPDGNFILYEWGNDGPKQTGQFLGRFTANGHIEGDWMAANGKRTLKFALHADVRTVATDTLMFEGKWQWEGDEGASFTLALREPAPGLLTGYHCSVTSNARRIDCSTEGDEVMDQGATIQGTIAGTSATLTFKSTYGLDSKGDPVTGKARIVRVGDSLAWRIIGETTGEHWLPYTVRLGRNTSKSSN